MSLFNVCDWWSTQCPDLEDNYDVSSLLCARFGLDQTEKDYIVVGTHTGYLSIYYPKYDTDINGKAFNYRATDLLFEQHDNSPILGVYSGRFNRDQNTDNGNQLAILHPYSVVIYNIKNVCGITEHGGQLQLQQLHAYRFKRTAFSLCKGHFGKVKGREFFCVVHLDGSVTFYEQDGIIYECKFPGDRALPTPIIYGERIDSFFRLASAWHLECFTYQDLSHSSVNKTDYQPIWSVCLGEGIIDMSIVQVKSEYASLMILGEHNFICISDTGQMEFILKLDYIPKCFHSFVIGYYWESTARLISVIISDKGKLFLYENANIIWGAHLKYEPPVAVRRSNINGLPGCIVTLGPTGQLRLGYLGSDPYQFQMPNINTKELNLSKVFDELKQLNQEIKDMNNKQDIEATNKATDEMVKVNFIINQEVNMDGDSIPIEDMPANIAIRELPIASGYCIWHNQVDLNELQIVFNMPDGIRCSKEALTYMLIKAGTTEQLNFEFYIIDLVHFPTAKIELIVSFITSKGIPCVTQRHDYLPLSMFFKVTQPQKSIGTELNFIMNPKSGKAMNFNHLFPEFITTADDDLLLLGLEALTSWDDTIQETVTILLSKKSDRIRIRSECVESLPLIVERLIFQCLHDPINSTDAMISGNNYEKLKVKNQINNTTQYITAAAYIPDLAILHSMDEHYRTQENIRKQQIELDVLWEKFKNLQRTLQEKFDDEPKDSLVMQIEEIYDKLILEGDKLMDMRKNVLRQRCDFSCCLMIGKLLLSIMNIDDKLVNVIDSVLTVPAEDWTELSCEESLAPGIDMLHHYGPLQCNKTNIRSPSAMIQSNSNEAKSTFDYIRFRYHFATLFKRLVKLAKGDDDTIEENPSLQSESVISTQSQKDLGLESGMKTIQISADHPNERQIEREIDEMSKFKRVSGMMHTILHVQPMPIQRSSVKRLTKATDSGTVQQNSLSLEAVTFNDITDDEANYNDQNNNNNNNNDDDDDNDGDDLRKLMFKKNVYHKKPKERDASASVKWSSDDNFERSARKEQELFNDLGIWW